MAKEVAVKEEVQFLALANAQGAIEALKSNLEGENLSPMDLDRVAVPGAGGISWCVPTLEGEETTQEIVGVIITVQNCRAYWREEFSGSGTPPDCSSDDAVTGNGDPGGVCAKCPNAQFGSATRGSGQACKQIKRLFMLRPTSMLPIVVTLPPTSIKPATKYLLRLAGAGLKYQAAVTRITLEKTKNSEGIAYSVAHLALAAKLDPDQAKAMEDYAAAMGPLLRRPVVADDFKE